MIEWQQTKKRDLRLECRILDQLYDKKMYQTEDALKLMTLKLTKIVTDEIIEHYLVHRQTHYVTVPAMQHVYCVVPVKRHHPPLKIIVRR